MIYWIESSRPSALESRHVSRGTSQWIRGLNNIDLEQTARELGIALTEEQLLHFESYESKITEWSDRTNLVSRGDQAHLRGRHFLDSLLALPYLPEGKHSLMDLGSGAGLPGIPIKIVRRDIKVTLLDSNRMKSLFLADVIKVLAFSGLSAIRLRAEEVPSGEELVTFDVVTARAVGVLPLLWKMAEPILNPGGFLLAFKGPEARQEWGTRAPKHLEVGYFEKIIPATGRIRMMVCVRKKVD